MPYLQPDMSPTRDKICWCQRFQVIGGETIGSLGTSMLTIPNQDEMPRELTLSDGLHGGSVRLYNPLTVYYADGTTSGDGKHPDNIPDTAFTAQAGWYGCQTANVGWGATPGTFRIRNAYNEEYLAWDGKGEGNVSTSIFYHFHCQTFPNGKIVGWLSMTWPTIGYMPDPPQEPMFWSEFQQSCRQIRYAPGSCQVDHIRGLYRSDRIPLINTGDGFWLNPDTGERYWVGVILLGGLGMRQHMQNPNDINAPFDYKYIETDPPNINYTIDCWFDADQLGLVDMCQPGAENYWAGPYPMVIST